MGSRVAKPAMVRRSAEVRATLASHTEVAAGQQQPAVGDANARDVEYFCKHFPTLIGDGLRRRCVVCSSFSRYECRSCSATLCHKTRRLCSDNAFVEEECFVVHHTALKCSSAHAQVQLLAS